MIVLLSCVGLLTSIIAIYFSCQSGDEIGTQIIRILSATILLLSFLFSPLLIKLLVVLAFALAWPYIGSRASLFFYRQLNK